MEWKKENISTSELEKRQKEYMNEALAMMKKSSSPDPLPEPKPAEQKPAEQQPDEQKPDDQPDAAAQFTEEASDKLSEPTDVPKTDVNVPDEQTSDEQKRDEQITDDSGDKYGVYTAEEIINSEYSGEGLRKAAEILEEMTRSTEMMKKLANSDNDPDTTDFPDFSDSIPKDGERFRGEQETEKCTAKET